MQDLGIIMKQNEIRMLVDAFDTNHDGVISLKEFLDFVNSGKPGSAALSNRCCWITTCKRTGMSNAFSVSEPTKKMLRKAGASSGEESKGGDSKEDDDDYGDDDDFDKDKGKSGNGNGKDKGLTVIRELANGDKRICVELIERRRREALLDAYGVLSPSNAADDKYDDEFDEYVIKEGWDVVCLEGYCSILLLPYSISSVVLESPDLLLHTLMIALALHNTIILITTLKSTATGTETKRRATAAAAVVARTAAPSASGPTTTARAACPS